MSDQNSPGGDQEPVQFSTAEANAVGAEFTEFFKRRLLMWALRWTIGFGLTWAIVRYWPEYSWLWWVAGGVAALSLALLLAGQWMVQRKVARTSNRIEEMNAFLREDQQQPRTPQD